jgi:hypothetical protein
MKSLTAGLTILLLLVSETQPAASRAAANEQGAFETAVTTRTTEALSSFIAQHPDSGLVDKAADVIWEILSSKFPSERYRAGATLAEMKRLLPDAIRAKRAFVIAFAPQRVSGDGRWSWTTHFRERHWPLGVLTVPRLRS